MAPVRREAGAILRPCDAYQCSHPTLLAMATPCCANIVFTMFKLIITECGGRLTEWQWCVCDSSDRPLKVGWKRTREEARHEAERALFNLLASGVTISAKKNIPPRGHSLKRNNQPRGN
jgi:hypothetical protein